MKSRGHGVYSSPFAVCAAIFAILLLADIQLVRGYVSDSLSLCVRAVIPSLFPFAVMTELIFFDGRGIVFPRFFRRAVREIFGVAENLSSAFVTGMITGFPMGAAAISRVYESGGCTKSEAEYAAAISGMPSPAFILGAVGASVFSSLHAGLFLMFIQFLSVIPVSILMRLTVAKRTSSEEVTVEKRQAPPFSLSVISRGIKNAGLNLLTVCSCVVFFTAVSGYIMNKVGIASDGNGVISALLSGTFELTAGVSRLGGTHILRALPCAAALIGFGGLSVLCQISSVCEKSGLSVLPFFISRIYFAFFNFTFTLAVEYLLPFAVPTFGHGFIEAITPRYESGGAVPYFGYAFIFALTVLLVKFIPAAVFSVIHLISWIRAKKVPHGMAAADDNGVKRDR